MARSSDFTFRDGERLIRFAEGALNEAPALLAQRGFEDYALLTTPRAAPELQAATVLEVAPGSVPDAAAAIRDQVEGRPLVAYGGGRVIDTAKALGGADGVQVAAIPTTLSGAPFTPFHRMPAGVEQFSFVRPSLVICEPALMASQPQQARAASAMNSLAHAMESLYAPLANPVAEGAALRAAALYGRSEQPALAAFLAGYAVGTAGLAVHHALCQTIVRTCGTPHAETNAVMLPHSARLMEPRAPAAMAAFKEALGRPLDELAARSGHTRLSELGLEEGQLRQVVESVIDHPGIAATPDPPGEQELLELLRAAL